MRVLWTHNFDPAVKNSGSFMYLLAEGVRQLGVDIELCYLGNIRSIINLYSARNKVKRIAREFDIVHAQFGSACAFVTASANNVPKVLSLRGSDWYRYNEKMNYQLIHSVISSFMTRRVIRRYKTVIAMSHRMENDIRRFYPDIPIISLPDPININIFKPLNKSSARAKLGFPNDTGKWILFSTISETNPIKRVPLAINAVNRANTMIEGIRLRVATNLPHEDMPLFVGSCDMALCTSVYEGWPNSIKEALACNLPFVSTDVSDLRGIASQEPSCHICLPEPDTIADSICKTLSASDTYDLRHHVIGMDVPLISNRLVELYQDVVLENRN